MLFEITRMKFTIYIFFFISSFCFAQVVKKTDQKKVFPQQDTLVIDSGIQDSLKIFKPTINYWVPALSAGYGNKVEKFVGL